MDFLISLLISGIISSALLIVGIVIYLGRLREISSELSDPSRRSLRAFGISNIFLVLVSLTVYILPNTVPIWIAGVLAGIIMSQFYLSVDNARTVRRIGIVLFSLILLLVLETLATIFIVPYLLPPLIQIIVLPSFIITSIVGSLYVLRESPSPFTVSMFIIIVFTLLAALTAGLGFIGDNPQYFILQIIPVVVGAGVLSSMLRPWRNIITLTLLSLILSVGPALFIPAYLGGDTTIFLFTITLTFALVCLIVPLGFFLQQAVQTRATTALYISLSLVCIALLALTHGNNFSIANSELGPTWDEGILFIDWLFGILAVSSFTMASIASSFSPTIRHATREVIIGFSCALLVLGHPIVRWVEIEGELVQRWELDPLYLGIIGLLIIAFIVFFKLAYQLWKVGSGRAGLRFIFFMFAALFLGIVAMFADNIPLDLLVPLLLMAGVMLILSSPKKNPFAQG